MEIDVPLTTRKSLKKLKSNTYQDIEDHYFSLEEHQKAFKASENILKRGEELYNTNKDSLRYYLVAAGKLQTVFVKILRNIML